jgi:hypothetical protein
MNCADTPKMSLSKPPREIISASRRTDIPSNPAALRAFLGGLEAGCVPYRHPMFKTPVEYKVSPEQQRVISWWSKNFAALLDVMSGTTRVAREVLPRYGHHFSFTINGERGSLLEPGLTASLDDRCAQLQQLAAACRQLGQDPDASIMVHVDPIVVYRRAGTSEDLDNLDHLPRLFAEMRACGLTRLHISFLQLGVGHARTRLRSVADVLSAPELSRPRQREVFERRVLPHLGGIKVQTCTAAWLAGEFPGIVSAGACVGGRDIASITGCAAAAGRVKPKGDALASGRGCTCYPHRDLGDKHDGCTNGCRYCFSNPERYAF